MRKGLALTTVFMAIVIAVVIVASTFAFFSNVPDKTVVTIGANDDFSISLGDAVGTAQLFPQTPVSDNSGDVSANVTVSVSELTVGSAAFEEGADEDERWNQYVSDTELQTVFTVAFASDANGTEITDNKFTLAPSGSQDIYMQVTWTTQSDEQDTFFGEYLDSLTWTISYSAVQSSERPDFPAP